ncbi:MAG: hypothetical protein ABJB40_14790, partial [Acidobacteriota bacterium]
MKNTFLALGLVLTVSASVLAQKSVASKTQATGQGSVTAGKGSDIQSGTQIAGELQSTLDVKRSNVGDQVVLKTTRSIKQNGQVVIEKGSRLVGRVTEVQQKVKGNADSKIGVLFDHIQNSNGSLMPITATIISITQARANASFGDDAGADAYGSSSTRTSTSSGSSCPSKKSSPIKSKKALRAALSPASSRAKPRLVIKVTRSSFCKAQNINGGVT